MVLPCVGRTQLQARLHTLCARRVDRRPAADVCRGAGSRSQVQRRVEPVEASPLDALTRAERAVAKKVAEGLTSRQIAEELFVSPRTVDAHLAHIDRELEIPSRARLAALMADDA